MMDKKTLMLIVIVSFLWFRGISTAEAQTNLEIDAFNILPPIRSFESFEAWIQIKNPDSVGHYFMVLFMLDGKTISQFGFISGNNSFENVHVTFWADKAGTMTLSVLLYQDASSVQDSPLVDDRETTITVEKGYLEKQIDNFNSLQTNISKLNNNINDLTNKLTYVSIALGAVAAAFIGTSIWLVTRKRKTAETTPKSDSSPIQTQ